MRVVQALTVACVLSVAVASQWGPSSGSGAQLTGASNGDEDVTFWKTAHLLSAGLFGHEDITVESEPEFEFSEFGASVEFDGVDDRILVNRNPIFDTNEFTIETLIFPFADLSSPEPRYLHIESPDTGDRRITMELRIVEGGLWYFDAFVKSEISQFTLIDPTLTHATDEWYHAAITYTADGLFTSYINGVEELNSTVATYLPLAENSMVSLGSRMNQIHYLSGLIDGALFTKRALTPEEFSIPRLITDNAL